MALLTIRNSLCTLTDFSDQEFQHLRELLSYNVPGSFFGSQHRPTKRYLFTKRGEFPTGLLYIVQKYYSVRRDTPLKTKDLRKRPEARHGLFDLYMLLTPYPEQINASRACQAHSRGIVVAPTGVGKSAIAALIINELKVPTLLVVPSLELKTQLLSSLGHAFGREKVGTLTDKRPIAVENVDALDTKVPLKGYDCVIIDEFHHSGAKTYRQLNLKCWNDVYYKFGLTATPFRSMNEERLLLESVLSEVIYEIKYHDAVKKKYIVPLEAYYIELPKKAITGYTWHEVYTELVVDNEERNEIIAELLSSFDNSGAPALCLVKEVRHGHILQNKCPNLNFIHGINPNNLMHLLEFKLQEKPVVIGTTGVLGEGVDTKPAEWIVIAGLGKSKNQFMQQCGRGFRIYPNKESCKIIIFKDPSHKWTLAHFKAQCKYLKEEYGVIPTLLK